LVSLEGSFLFNKAAPRPTIVRNLQLQFKLHSNFIQLKTSSIIQLIQQQTVVQTTECTTK
jgi:hypothetical protein